MTGWMVTAWAASAPRARPAASTNMALKDRAGLLANSAATITEARTRQNPAVEFNSHVISQSMAAIHAPDTAAMAFPTILRSAGRRMAMMATSTTRASIHAL